NILYYTKSAPLDNSKPNFQAISDKDILTYENNTSNRDIISEINSIIINKLPEYSNNITDISIKALIILICEYILFYNILNLATSRRLSLPCDVHIRWPGHHGDNVVGVLYFQAKKQK
ncbi:uncharacterized protein BO88DRAFT_375329, partial [Aspergillus vadensis CBS 113365]